MVELRPHEVALPVRLVAGRQDRDVPQVILVRDALRHDGRYCN